MTVFPSDRRCPGDHFRFPLGGDFAALGVSAHTVDLIGEVTVVGLPAVVDSFAEGEQLGTIASALTVLELAAPIAGTVVRVNPVTGDEPEQAEDDPNARGWLVALKRTGGQALDCLIAAALDQAETIANCG